MTEAEREKLEQEREDERKRADAAEKERDDMKTRLDAMENDAKRKDAEESERQAVAAAEKEKADKKRRDSRKDRHDKHDGDVMDCARCDSEEKEEQEVADKKRRDAAAPEQNIDPNREEQIKDSKRLDAALAEIAALKAAQEPPSHEEANALATAFHRADAVFQMLGERPLQPYPGEKSTAFRRRVVDSLRQQTTSFKDETIADSVSGVAFDWIESKIYDEAIAHAKNPVISDSNAFRLREHKDTVSMPGKVVTRFFGDSRAAFAPFMPQRGIKITRINRPQQGAQV